MMRPNPANFEAFIDPNGGEWIKVKTGQFKDVIWRPTDMMVGEEREDGSANLSFTTEFLGDVPEKLDLFEKVAGNIIYNIIETQLKE
ncbi:MAG: hypothetical protein JAZ07_00400 [Candidatus Thiodiazotropha endolucinida]|uniref:Uncharacterized protein n=1 Tax=Candidatus Thiodiazotropha taylori TaxID=2792791 RepID=A0A9E4N330_9GAMM|nr:hypothetical protein [Candidatus Thiodiazotropha taylori]